MVQSSPEKNESRILTRNFFGHDCLVSDSCDLVFIMGRPKHDAIQVKIKEEQESFGDILQEDFEDSYNNLTLKSLFSLKFFRDHSKR